MERRGCCMSSCGDINCENSKPHAQIRHIALQVRNDKKHGSTAKEYVDVGADSYTVEQKRIISYALCCTLRCFWSAALTLNTYSLVYKRRRLSLLIFGSRCSSRASSLKGTTTCVPSGNNTSTVLTCAFEGEKRAKCSEIIQDEPRDINTPLDR